VAKRYETSRIIKVPRFEEEAGFYATKERSAIMSRIKGKNTTPEILLRKALWAQGVRYRMDYKALPGKPDIVIVKHKVAIFIDGEFWHGYEWEKKRKTIKSNRKFWIAKIERNMQRDIHNNVKLKELGYEVIRFWAADVKKDVAACVKLILVSLDHENL